MFEKQLKVHKTFTLTLINARTKYVVFPFATISMFVFFLFRSFVFKLFCPNFVFLFIETQFSIVLSWFIREQSIFGVAYTFQTFSLTDFVDIRSSSIINMMLLFICDDAGILI